jgi:hypothetical protein
MRKLDGIGPIAWLAGAIVSDGSTQRPGATTRADPGARSRSSLARRGCGARAVGQAAMAP